MLEETCFILLRQCPFFFNLFLLFEKNLSLVKLQISKNANKILIKCVFIHTLVWGYLFIESGVRKDILGKKSGSEQREALLLQGEWRGKGRKNVTISSSSSSRG